MNIRVLFLLVILSMVGGNLFADNIEEQGKLILSNADKRFYPTVGSYELYYKQTDVEGKTTEGSLQGYKKGLTAQSFVMKSPPVNKNNVGIRVGDTIYFKMLKWPKPDIMSYQATFMNSTFSFGDIISSDIAIDYKTSKIEKTKENGKDVWYLVLLPKKGELYARIDVWIDTTTFDTYKRLYYTASGEKLKIAVYSDITAVNGIVTGFKIDMEDYIQQTKTFAEVSKIKNENLPAFLFDPQSIGRIHAN